MTPTMSRRQVLVPGDVGRVAALASAAAAPFFLDGVRYADTTGDLPWALMGAVAAGVVLAATRVGSPARDPHFEAGAS